MRRQIALVLIGLWYSSAAPAAAQPSTMGDGQHVDAPRPRAAEPPRRGPDNSAVYFGLGIATLGVLFWWNRRRRERFEAEDTADDDLHAAADPPKEKSE